MGKNREGGEGGVLADSNYAGKLIFGGGNLS